MVIGNGLIGKELKKIDKQNVLFFASGVSNSKESNIDNFYREKILLREKLDFYSNHLFIYISSCSIFDNQIIKNDYSLHKQEMEKIVMSHNSYLIIRLPQVVGISNNPNTLTNFLYNKLKNSEYIEILNNIERNLIDVSDVSKIINLIIQTKITNKIINVANIFNISINELIGLMSKIIKIEPKIIIKHVEFMGHFYIDISETRTLVNNYDNIFVNDYYYNLLYKYYNN